jgi:gliding motility-associated protein GldM
MIGMMYLVLTAMLALNVAKEAVEAFKNIEKGLSLTIKNYTLKNNLIYEEFEKSFQQYPEKTRPYRTKALLVKERAEELFGYLQGLKVEIVSTAEPKRVNEIVQGNEVNIEEVEKIDDNNVPSQILIGANDTGKAFGLRTMINEYCDFLINDIIQGENPIVQEALLKSLNTDDVRNKRTEEMEKWPNHNFQALPLVYVITMLSKIQVDVRNAETEVLNHLFAQIDKSNFKFNKVSAVVIPKSTYVTLGSNYEASVFVSATDSTQAPLITVNDQTLPLDESGKGVYSIKPSRTGITKWGGIISLKAPDGTTKTYDFNSEYTVENPNVVISPTAMNVMYAGIPNPIDISVPGVATNRIRIKVPSNGTWSTDKVKNPKGENFPGNWAIIPQAAGTLQILVSTEVDGKVANYPAKEFRVKNLPDPIAQLAGKTTGLIDKNTLMAQRGITAILPESDFYIVYTVTGFSVFYTDNMGDQTEPAEGWQFTERQKTVLNRLTRGRTLFITNITAVGPDKKSRQLPPISLKIN